MAELDKKIDFQGDKFCTFTKIFISVVNSKQNFTWT